MDKGQVIEIANNFDPTYQWVPSTQLSSGGWILEPADARIVIDDGLGVTNVGLPGMYIDSEGRPYMMYGPPGGWPREAIEALSELTETDESEYIELFDED
ncbi:hypothetical protein [Corynebacterium stationis]|uniref:hypothetical protein n=1 Tax=Corynebacterium stationis TaxID=1705 RepID=UPI00263B9B4F|nr:hypothetical protein [Corynebacterium stationis]